MATDTPALIIAEGTTARERRVLTRLDRLAADVVAAQFTGPVLFLIGRVASLCDGLDAAAVAALPACRGFPEAVHA